MASSITTARWLVGLVTLATFINYVDRGTLATAAPLIKDELHLSNIQFGVVTSAFFWAYTPGQLLSSWLTERLNPYRALALGFTVWSAATALTGLANGFVALVLLRILLGLGESTAAPSGAKLVVDRVPASSFGIVSGIIGAGIAFGPSFGTLAGGQLMAHYGWRAMFAVFGVAALLWLWPWLAFSRASAALPRETEPVAAPSYIAILSQRSLWGGVFGHLTANYALYFLLSWLPLYLVKQRGFSIVEMAEVGSVVYAIYGVSSIGWGWLADRWIVAGTSLNTVRKTVICTGHFGLAFCLVGAALSGVPGSVIFLMVSGLFCGMIASSLAAITQTLAGPPAAAKWTGLQNMLANIAGIVAPIVTGFVVDSTGSFNIAFFVAAAVAIVGAAGWTLVIRRVEAVQWSTRR